MASQRLSTIASLIIILTGYNLYIDFYTFIYLLLTHISRGKVKAMNCKYQHMRVFYRHYTFIMRILYSLFTLLFKQGDFISLF